MHRKIFNLDYRVIYSCSNDNIFCSNLIQDTIPSDTVTKNLITLVLLSR